MERDKAKRRDLVALVSFVLVMLAARSALADHYVVPSDSMNPTVHVGDRFVAFKAAYGLRVPWTEHWLIGPSMPARGDVVVLSSPETGIVLVKRVAAVAGDRVEVRSGRLSIDGRAIEVVGGVLERLGSAPHAVRFDLGGGPDFGPVVVPAGHVLVMGDNRGNSHDGRSFGFVRIEALLGRAVAVYLRDGSVSWREL